MQSCCSVPKSCLILCDPMVCSTPYFPVLHYLTEFIQTHVHWVSDAIQLSHPLSSPSPLALNFNQTTQDHGWSQWVSSSNQETKVLELQLSAAILPTNRVYHGKSGLMTHKPESRLLGEISQLQICRWYHSNDRSVRANRASWWEWKHKSEKAGLKLNVQKTKTMASSPITSQ